MKLKKQISDHSPRLLLFFAGWSAVPELFAGLKVEEGTDLIICYDYREISFEEDLNRYDEIHMVAWSMGVRMAELAVGGKWTFATATAVNGTPLPIDDAYGIPVDIFRGTLENLTAENLIRFNRRMCGSREVLARYMETQPRALEDVRQELQHIYDMCHAIPETDAGMQAPHATAIHWTRAVIGTDDRIFLSANQRNYWSGRCPITEIVSPHYPFHLWKQWNEL